MCGVFDPTWIYIDTHESGSPFDCNGDEVPEDGIGQGHKYSVMPDLMQ